MFEKRSRNGDSRQKHDSFAEKEDISRVDSSFPKLGLCRIRDEGLYAERISS